MIFSGVQLGGLLLFCIFAAAAWSIKGGWTSEMFCPRRELNCGLHKFVKISKSGLEMSWVEVVILLVRNMEQLSTQVKILCQFQCHLLFRCRNLPFSRLFNPFSKSSWSNCLGSRWASALKSLVTYCHLATMAPFPSRLVYFLNPVWSAYNHILICFLT